MLLTISVVPQYAGAFSPDTYTWSSPNLTYSIDSSFSSLGSNYVTVLTDAISDWNSSATPIIFTLSSSSSNTIKAADLGVGPLAQVPPHHPLGTNFRFSPFTLTINTRYLSQFYVGPRASTVSASQYDLRSVIRHELGHTFGLCHTWDNSAALMWPNTNLGEVHNIDQDALNGANYVYNPGSTPITPEGGCGNTSNPLIASAGTYDDTFADGTRSYQITYGNAPSWARVGNSPSWYNAAGQTLSYTNVYNARANIKFNGSRITRRSTMASNRGQAQIYLDGQFWGTMNDQTAETRWQIARTWTFASNGTHTLEVRNVGGGGGYIDVDSFIVDVAGISSGTYDDYQTSNIQHIGSWTASANFPSAYNGTIRYSNTATSSAGTTFYGDRITYYYTAAANRGKASVTIDGVDYGYIDLYSATTQWQRSMSWGLSLGYHTIFIGVSGQKNPASSDTYVDIDKFVVNGY